MSAENTPSDQDEKQDSSPDDDMNVDEAFHERYNDPTASIVFKSEDNVKFRVHDYMMKAAS